MAFLLLVCVVLCLSVKVGMGQNMSVDFNPQLTPYALPGRLTTNTAMLMQPRCYFDSLPSLPCTPAQCEVWLVSATDTGTSNFDDNQQNPNIFNLSPYPTAFLSNTSNHYFLTQVGLQSDFPCTPYSATEYFRVGADGSCSTTNCNGVLPVGSTVRFKYLLVDPTSKTILADSLWSNDITLYSMKDPNTIYDGLPGRWASMIVIISILCVALFLLLVFLLAMLIYTCCCRQEKRTLQKLDSLRIGRYDTHNLRDRIPHDNPAYENEPKEFGSFQDLAASSQKTVNPIKLKSYTNYDPSKATPATEL